jgi:hypothetical protein
MFWPLSRPFIFTALGIIAFCGLLRLLKIGRAQQIQRFSAAANVKKDEVKQSIMSFYSKHKDQLDKLSSNINTIIKKAPYKEQKIIKDNPVKNEMGYLMAKALAIKDSVDMSAVKDGSMPWQFNDSNTVVMLQTSDSRQVVSLQQAIAGLYVDTIRYRNSNHTTYELFNIDASAIKYEQSEAPDLNHILAVKYIALVYVSELAPAVLKDEYSFTPGFAKYEINIYEIETGKLVKQGQAIGTSNEKQIVRSDNNGYAEEGVNSLLNTTDIYRDADAAAKRFIYKTTKVKRRICKL